MSQSKLCAIGAEMSVDESSQGDPGDLSALKKTQE